MATKSEEQLLKHYKDKQYDLKALGIKTTLGCGGSFGDWFVCTAHHEHKGRTIHIATGIDEIVLTAGYEVVEKVEQG